MNDDPDHNLDGHEPQDQSERHRQPPRVRVLGDDGVRVPSRMRGVIVAVGTHRALEATAQTAVSARAGSVPPESMRISRANLPLAAICTFVAAIGLWNVTHYPPGLGFDADSNIPYADGLIPGLNLPHGTGSYYTPPGFYAAAGVADWVAKGVGLGEPHRAAMALNELFLIGTVILVALIARRLWPGRERIALGAAAFVALLPVTVETATMFHPEPLSLFLSTLALWLYLRLLDDPRYVWALGATLGAAQLVRAFALWTVAVVAIALIVGRRWRQLAVVLAVAVVIPAPWYIHQATTYSGSPVFPRPTVAKPIYERQPASFYLDPGLPQVVTAPFRPHFVNKAWPEIYAGTWGDWFGVWSWNASATPAPSPGARHALIRQSLVGILPTLLAIGGWLIFLRSARRDPARLAVALLPLAGIAGLLYFAISYPTADGDTIKATYMLTTTVGWALGFGYALDRLRGRLWYAALALLALGALVELPFLLY